MAARNPFASIAPGHALAEAIVDAVREPLLVLDLDLRVIAASRSFYTAPSPWRHGRQKADCSSIS